MGFPIRPVINVTYRRSMTTMESVTDQVCSVIRQRILSAEYAGGEFLQEQSLAEALDVSITPVHEALRRLAAAGWVEIIPYRGSRVMPWTQEDAFEVFELRALLESHAVRRSAIRIRPPQLRRLEAIVDAEYELLNSQAFSHERQSELNLEFHEIIMAAACSRRLQRSLETVLHDAVSARSTYGLDHVAIKKSLDEHWQIVDALKAGDSDRAADVMHTHIMSVARSQPQPADS